jgi:hypothetical protein
MDHPIASWFVHAGCYNVLLVTYVICFSRVNKSSESNACPGQPVTVQSSACNTSRHCNSCARFGCQHVVTRHCMVDSI